MGELWGTTLILGTFYVFFHAGSGTFPKPRRRLPGSVWLFALKKETMEHIAQTILDTMPGKKWRQDTNSIYERNTAIEGDMKRRYHVSLFAAKFLLPPGWDEATSTTWGSRGRTFYYKIEDLNGSSKNPSPPGWISSGYPASATWNRPDGVVWPNPYRDPIPFNEYAKNLFD